MRLTTSRYLTVHSKDGLRNCVHLPGTVTCHSPNPKCPIRSTKVMTLHNNNCTALTEETPALVDLPSSNRLPLYTNLDLAAHHKTNNREQAPCTAATHDVHMRRSSDLACDSHVTVSGKWMQLSRPSSERWQPF